MAKAKTKRKATRRKAKKVLTAAQKVAALKAKLAKATEKKTSKEVLDLEEKNFDYKDDKDMDNVIGAELLNGFYVEMKDPKNIDKTIEEVKELVTKNLAKDSLYYVKDGQFGIKGLGYVQEEQKEAKGKHKASGYGDID